MRAATILQQTITRFLASVHAKRLAVVFWAVQTLMVGNHLSLTGIGRAKRSRGRGDHGVKHSIKRVDRLLGNEKLHGEMVLFFYSIARVLVGGKQRPVILVDWTEAGLEHVALIAALPTDGRALTVYAEVHPLKKVGNAAVQKHFLRKLHAILPTGCRPIIVTDAGFKNAWFKEIFAWGWDFVGRVRGSVMACPEHGSRWLHIRELFGKAVLTARDLGWWFIAKYNPVGLRLVSVKKRCIRTTLHGTTAAKKGRKRAMEPWLLATSLADATPKKIVSIYGSRMQIEETFRDAKNHRFGWSFEDSRSTTCERIQVLLLIAVLGMLAVTLLGQAAERRGDHLAYQANRTRRGHRVLSLFFLGKNIIGSGDDHRYSPSYLRGCLDEIREKVPVLGAGVVSDFAGIP
jgi:hypothetical protein